jgi:O-antigen/teichoic acid export membrane protein
MFLGMAQWILLSILAMGFGVFASYSGALGNIQNAARQRIIFSLHNVADAWFKIALAVVCIGFLGGISVAAALGFFLTAVLITISQLFFIKKLPSPPQAINRAEVPEDWGRLMLLFSRPFLIWGVFGWMQQSSSRWALGLLSSTDDVGFFSVLYQLGYAPMVMISSLGLTFITPVLFARVGNATDEIRVKNLIRTVFILTAISAALLLIAVWIAVVFHEAIFALAAGAEYKAQSYYLPYMVFAGGLFAISQVIATIPTSLNVPSTLLLASIGSSLIGIAGAFAGAYYYSFEGVVFSLIIHSASHFILCCLAIRKIINDNSYLSSLSKTS